VRRRQREHQRAHEATAVRLDVERVHGGRVAAHDDLLEHRQLAGDVGDAAAQNGDVAARPILAGELHVAEHVALQQVRLESSACLR
jgi:hypothetical protein